MDTSPIVEIAPVGTMRLTSTNKFVFLNIITFNLYSLWWTYKAWRLFRDRGETKILPALWAILGIFTLYSLFERIKVFAKSSGRRNNYPSGALFAGIIISNLFGFIPSLWATVSMLQFLFFIKPFEVYNYGIKNSKEYTLERDKATMGQIVLIAVGTAVWLYLIIVNVINLG